MAKTLTEILSKHIEGGVGAYGKLYDDLEKYIIEAIKADRERVATMKIYGVYQGSGWDGLFLQAPVYIHLKDAIKSAEKLVTKSQKEVIKMQDFTKNDGLSQEYKNWRKVEDHVWKGGYRNQDEIRIETLELVK